jgi:hypothetical protein
MKQKSRSCPSRGQPAVPDAEWEPVKTITTPVTIVDDKAISKGCKKELEMSLKSYRWSIAIRFSRPWK